MMAGSISLASVFPFLPFCFSSSSSFPRHGWLGVSLPCLALVLQTQYLSWRHGSATDQTPFAAKRSGPAVVSKRDPPGSALTALPCLKMHGSGGLFHHWDISQGYHRSETGSVVSGHP